MARMIWITRHGNRQDDDQQWRRTAERPDDPDLSAAGIRQARELARPLAGLPIDHLFSSPYLRTMHTAHFCALAINLPINIEDGIGEWLDPAKFSAMPRLLPRRELARRFRVNERYQPIHRPVYPEGPEMLYSRCRLVINKILAATSGNLLLVGHSASCKAVIFSLLGRQLPLEIPVCSLTQLEQKQDSWHLRLTADISFLSEQGSVNSEK
jgi:broad specificity phosphatase PhoE